MTYDFKVLDCGKANLEEQLNALGKEGFAVAQTYQVETTGKPFVIMQRVLDPAEGAAYSKGGIHKE